jgi:hypothetical protein
MAEPHVTSALRTKPAELAGTVSQLERQLIQKRSSEVALQMHRATMRHHGRATVSDEGGPKGFRTAWKTRHPCLCLHRRKTWMPTGACARA